MKATDNTVLRLSVVRDGKRVASAVLRVSHPWDLSETLEGMAASLRAQFPPPSLKRKRRGRGKLRVVSSRS